MYTLISFIIIVFITTVVISQQDSEEETNKIQSLCEDSIINSADRLLNNTVRLYRGEYYWLLNGLPDSVGYLEGPFKIWYRNMGSIFRNNTVVTLLSGQDKGSVYKTQDQQYWAWNKDGEQFAGGIKGNYWEVLPQGGLEAAFHDGNDTHPTFVGFKAITVYYFSTKNRLWTNDKKDGYMKGRDGENFPTDLTAAFSWPPQDTNDGYIVYLFKRDKYCKRTKFLKSNKNCDEWIENKVLFGCSGGSTGTGQEAIPSDEPKASTNGSPEDVHSSPVNHVDNVPQKSEIIDSPVPKQDSGHIGPVAPPGLPSPHETITKINEQIQKGMSNKPPGNSCVNYTESLALILYSICLSILSICSFH